MCGTCVSGCLRVSTWVSSAPPQMRARWYEYINGPRGREAKNGDVRLVVGCDKATSWGMAVLSDANQTCQLKFKPFDGQIRHTWACEYSGTPVMYMKAGPDQQIIDELRWEDPGESIRDGYLNQCLFVRTLEFPPERQRMGKIKPQNWRVGIQILPQDHSRHDLDVVRWRASWSGALKGIWNSRGRKISVVVTTTLLSMVVQVRRMSMDSGEYRLK
jgi:hypothetical protein